MQELDIVQLAATSFAPVLFLYLWQTQSSLKLRGFPFENRTDPCEFPYTVKC